jgi:hypothetical protein
MNIVDLPNGRIVNPAHVDSVKVHPHFWDKTKFYVQLVLKMGGTEHIAEKLCHDAAVALRDKYVGMIRAAYGEVEAYRVGYEEGYEQGRSEGHAAGKAEGRNSGYAEGLASANNIYRERFLSEIFEFREQLITEQRHGTDLQPSRRRYLRDSITAITDLIERFSRLPSRE